MPPKGRGKGKSPTFNFEKRDKASKTQSDLDSSKRNHSDISSSSSDSFDSAKSPSLKQKPQPTISESQPATAGTSGASRDTGLNSPGTSAQFLENEMAVTNQSNFADCLLESLSRPDIVEKLSLVFQTSCATLVDCVNDLKSALEALRITNNDQASQISTLKDDNKKLRDDLDETNEKLNDLEQYGRRYNLVISNPNWDENRNENTDALVHELAWNLGIQLPPWAIDRSHRIGKPHPNRPRNILVRFTGYRPREALYGARINLNNQSKIYINEDLTTSNSKLFYEARILKKQGKIDSALTRDGRIFVNKFKGDPVARIKSIKELEDVVSKSTYSAALGRPGDRHNTFINQRLFGHAGMSPQQNMPRHGGPPPLQRPPAPNLMPQGPPQRGPAPRATGINHQLPPATTAPATPTATTTTTSSSASNELNAGATAFNPSAASTPAHPDAPVVPP